MFEADTWRCCDAAAALIVGGDRDRGDFFGGGPGESEEKENGVQSLEGSIKECRTKF